MTVADARREKWMREQRRIDRVFITIAVVVGVGTLVGYLAFVYLVAHFIGKYW